MYRCSSKPIQLTSLPVRAAAGLLILALAAAAPVWAQPAYEFPDYIKASNTEDSDYFAYAIAADGNTLVVGAQYEDSAATGVNGDQSDNSESTSGAVYVFVRDPNGDWSQQAYLKASNSDGGDRFGGSVAISGDTIVVGAQWEDSSATGVNGDQSAAPAYGSGAAYVFVRSGTTWTQQAYLKASNTDGLDDFGTAVAIHADTIVVGAPNEDSFASGINGNQFDNTVSNAGAAYVFVRSGTTWTQQAYLKASNTDAEDRFGQAVAVHGDRIAVGAPMEDSNATGANGNQASNSEEDAGAVYLFARSGLTWQADGYIKASNTDDGDEFGGALDLHGDTLAVGSRLERGGDSGINGDQSSNISAYAGAVYVFENDGLAWAQSTYIKASRASGLSFFGKAVDLTADRLIVGANGEDSGTVGVDGNQDDFSANSSGAAYVFERALDSWQQISYLKASNTDAADNFGFSVAIADGFAAAGAFFEQGAAVGINGDASDNSLVSAGAVYAFAAPPTYSIAGVVNGLIGDGLVIQLDGAELLPVSADGLFQFSTVLNDGQSYTVSVLDQPSSPTQFCRLVNASGVINGDDVVDLEVNCDPPVPDPEIVFDEYIKATNTDNADEFGFAVSVDGDTLVVGAPFEDSATGGIGGAQDNNLSLDAGAVYVYTRDGSGSWSFQNYIKASNPDSSDQFGFSVALSGDTLAVGAPGEDSDATGFNGDQLNNNAADSGAVYVFIRDGSGQWFPEAYLKASNTDPGDAFGSSVAISGDTLIAGAPAEASSTSGVDSNQSDDTAPAAGAGYVFVRSGSIWSQQAYLKPLNTDAGDEFGVSVDVDADHVIVGARFEDGDGAADSDNSAPQSGAAYVFLRSGTSWVQEAYLKADAPDAGDLFGFDVALEGRFAVVGAELADGPDNNSSNAGAVFVFERLQGSWVLDQALSPSNTEADDRFGIAVDIDGDQIVVGAWLEDSASSEVNGNESDNSLTHAGAAYLFTRAGESWQQTHYLKAREPDESDFFGTALGISGNIIAVGATGEDGADSGLGGDPSDDAGLFTGAVYTYDATIYAVGGSVSGATGPGLVLRLNGEEQLEIVANGPFEFDQQLLAGAFYSVEIVSLPGTPEQICTLSNGSGYVLDGDVTSIQLACINAYRVGGTVSGVSGPGLVLRNNGGDDLAITSNGTFIFPTRVGDGQSYDVTIAATPAAPEQRCLVSNGSGSVQGQNVTNVQVQCQNIFPIGGSVSGLAGDGLILQNNDGDRLPISGNGTFEFGQSLPDGSSFEVTVLRNPDSPPQLCQVTNGTGTVPGQAVTNVQVDCISGYRIGGTVSGVDGPGVVLQNEAGPPLFILENGLFEFPRYVLDGNSYQVTVLSTSANPPQTCDVINGSGVVQGQDVVDILVECQTGYRLGGNATGLMGPGLVLQNNGSNDLPITANGSFNFNQWLLSGEAYDVTIAAEPSSPEQLCEVTNGSGDVIASNVEDVGVECSLARRVGGSVSGLQGSGLVLALNETSLLPVSGNGSFQFPEPLSDGSAYEVLIQSQPVSPEQLCSVSNGTGTADGGDVTTVEIACDPPQGAGGQIQFSEAALAVLESDGVLQLTLQRQNGSDGEVTVRILSEDGSARAGEDFVALDIQRTWSDADTADQTVDLLLIDDSLEEPSEQLQVRLEIVSGNALTGAITEVEITINDTDIGLFADRFEGE